MILFHFLRLLVEKLVVEGVFFYYFSVIVQECVCFDIHRNKYYLIITTQSACKET